MVFSHNILASAFFGIWSDGSFPNKNPRAGSKAVRILFHGIGISEFHRIAWALKHRGINRSQTQTYRHRKAKTNSDENIFIFYHRIIGCRSMCTIQ